MDDGSAPPAVTNQVPSNALSQIDGGFAVDSGTVDSIGLASSSIFKTGVQTLFNNAGSPLTQRIVFLNGRLDGISSNGRVTYLAGHDYSLALPISSNPQTNGVRLFLNSIFESGCATDPIQDGVVLTKSAPAYSNNGQITYTINYSNPGPRPVENLKLTDKVPAGATYVSGSGSPAPSSTAGGVVTWNLPPLASGSSGSVTFMVAVASDGTYSNAATMEFAHMTVNKVTSNTVTTVVDTDSDGDGVLNSVDNCPTTPNPDQRDTNGDGVGDLCTPFQYATGGQFVIGNLVNMSSNSNVNFWGSQWSQNNPMSGGSAPKGFKGFEDGTALPACGSSWTSRPGNSSNPPATIPTNMAVIVSSAITKSGSIIYGNVKKIVVVRTNPGYGPAPGKVGTGKVIAILCEVP